MKEGIKEVTDPFVNIAPNQFTPSICVGSSMASLPRGNSGHVAQTNKNGLSLSTDQIEVLRKLQGSLKQSSDLSPGLMASS